MKPTNPASTDTHARDGRAPKRAAATPRPRKRQLRPQATETLMGIAATVERLSMFTAAIRSAGLEGLLGEEGPFTIFAPTDRAFQQLPHDELAALLADQPRLARVLCHHVVPGRVKAPKLQEPGIALPVSGGELSLTTAADAFHVDDARLVKTNIRATNGVIHAIDAVLMIA